MAVSPVVLTTDSVDAGDRFDFWREAVCRTYIELEARPLAGVDGFHGSVTGVAVGGVKLARGSVAHVPHLASRTPAMIARADEHYFMIGLVLGGACAVVQDERTAVMHPGDFGLADTSRPYTLHIDGELDLLTVQVPQAAMRAVLPRVCAVTATSVNGREGSAALVRPLLDMVMSTAGSASPAVQGHRVAAAVELVAASLAETTSLPVDAPHRAANLARAKQYIEENLWDPDLSLEAIARAVFVSPRYLQARFRDDGISVARYVMSRRLDRAHHDLADPRLAHLPVADIAARLGFKRPSHFSSVFKNRFGVSPREHRTAARRRLAWRL